MANYNTIRGLRVKYLSADPSNPEDGQVWYNSTTGNLRVDGILQAGSWASGGALNTQRTDSSGTGATPSSMVTAGGYTGSARTVNTEIYNGTAWTETGNMSTARFAGGMAGTQTAAWYASGNSSPGGGRTAATEEFGGTSWTSGGNVNTARQQTQAQVGGSLTAGIMFGGNGPTPANTTTEYYDGSSWTTQSGTLNDGRWNAMGTGTQAAAVMAGADNPLTANVEEWNGSAWSEVNNLPTVRASGMAGGNSQTAMKIISGQAPPSSALTATCFDYDGTNWAAAPSVATARGLGAGSSANTVATSFICGGTASPGVSTVTEEFTGAAIVVKNLSTS